MDDKNMDSAISTEKKAYIILFLKGILMGICDIVPGISGGTIAFITGIYERLINAVKGFSPKIIYDIFLWIKRRDKESLDLVKDGIKKLDPVFLIIVFSGIITSILLMSRLMSFLLENYLAYVLSFFIGLILASSKVIFDSIENHELKNIMFGTAGIVFGLTMSFLMPADINPGLIYIFIAGFFAISAMFIPGISGAFILLVMGVYNHMIDVLQNVFGRITEFIAFMLGAAMGAFTVSRVISYLFSKDKCKTLYFLLGLVIGVLSMPVRDVANNTASFSSIQFIFIFFLFVAGIIPVWAVRKIEKSMGS